MYTMQSFCLQFPAIFLTSELEFWMRFLLCTFSPYVYSLPIYILSYNVECRVKPISQSCEDRLTAIILNNPSDSQE